MLLIAGLIALPGIGTTPALASPAVDVEERPSTRALSVSPEKREQARNLRQVEPSRAILEVYQHYQDTVQKAGADLRFDLRSFRTLELAEYRNHRWIDIFSPPTGWRLRQERTYYTAPWLEEQHVYYDLQWFKVDPAKEEETFRGLREMREWTILDAAEWLTSEGHWQRVPFAITTFRVHVSFEGRSRQYRATAFWYPGEEKGDFTLTIQDRIVLEVDSAMGEKAEVVREEDLGRGPDPDRQGVSSMTGALGGTSCEAKTQTISNTRKQTWDIQGHQAGRHEARFKMQATCIAGSDCYNQCDPFVLEKNCFETSGSDLRTGCEHEPNMNHSISANSSQGATSVQCGGAMGCGVRECCGIGSCYGGVNISFSGSGGGLTASVSSSVSDPVYSMSISDRVTCPAPVEEQQDPCASQFSSSGGSGSGSESDLGLVTDAIFIPCDDGGGGAGDPSAGQDEPDPGSGTPIMLDLGRGGLDLTDAGGGVDFDLDADGIVERISWTTAGSADAFLVLDRDGNGGIDHGGELFGDATPQPDPGEGGQRHGFLALAVFDTAAEGGDGDGSITAADAVFDRLELWRDADHDGIADVGELTSLAEAGVVSLGLDYVENRSRDRHGNELRYRGHCQWVGPAGNAHTKPMIDVIFVQQ